VCLLASGQIKIARTGDVSCAFDRLVRHVRQSSSSSFMHEAASSIQADRETLGGRAGPIQRAAAANLATLLAQNRSRRLKLCVKRVPDDSRAIVYRRPTLNDG